MSKTKKKVSKIDQEIKRLEKELKENRADLPMYKVTLNGWQSLPPTWGGTIG